MAGISLKSKFISGLILLLLLAVLAGCQSGHLPYETTSAREAARGGDIDRSPAPQVLPGKEAKGKERIGILDYRVLEEAHPLYEKIRILRGELEDYRLQQQELYDQVQEMKSRALDNYSGWEEDDPARINTLREIYREKIKLKKKEFQQELNRLEEETWKEFTEAIEARRRELTAEARKEIDRIEEENQKKLAAFQEELEEEYYNPILNLKWKLQFLHLTEAEKVSYQNNLKSLLAEKEMRLKAKEQEINSVLKERVREIEQQVTHSLEEYYQRKQKETLKFLEEKRRELQTKLEEEIKELEGEFNQQVNRYRDELRRKNQTYLERTLKNLETELQQKLAELEKKKQKVLEEIKNTENKIEEELQDLITQVADQYNLDVVLKTYRTNVNAINITRLILEKLK